MKVLFPAPVTPITATTTFVSSENPGECFTGSGTSLGGSRHSVSSTKAPGTNNNPDEFLVAFALSVNSGERFTDPQVFSGASHHSTSSIKAPGTNNDPDNSVSSKEPWGRFTGFQKSSG